MSTLGVYHDQCRGYYEYTGEFSVHWGDMMIPLEGYYEYTKGCSVHWGIIMSTLGDTNMHVGG